MRTKKVEPRPKRPSNAESQIIGFRLPRQLAKDIKIEAVRRQIPLNGLLAEMWDMYRDRKRERRNGNSPSDSQQAII